MKQCSICNKFTDNFSNSQLKKNGGMKCKDCINKNNEPQNNEEKMTNVFKQSLAEIADCFMRLKLKQYTGLSFPSAFISNNKRAPQLTSISEIKKLRPIMASVYKFYSTMSTEEFNECKNNTFFSSARSSVMYLAGQQSCSSNTLNGKDMGDEEYKKIFLETREKLLKDVFINDYKDAIKFMTEEKQHILPKITNYELIRKLSIKEMEDRYVPNRNVKFDEPPALFVKYEFCGEEYVTVWACPDENMILDDVILVADKNKYVKFI
jgi:hypothetical protein